MFKLTILYSVGTPKTLHVVRKKLITGIGKMYICTLLTATKLNPNVESCRPIINVFAYKIL